VALYLFRRVQHVLHDHHFCRGDAPDDQATQTTGQVAPERNQRGGFYTEAELIESGRRFSTKGASDDLDALKRCVSLFRRSSARNEMAIRCMLVEKGFHATGTSIARITLPRW
jgi:hypothetical protein